MVNIVQVIGRHNVYEPQVFSPKQDGVLFIYSCIIYRAYISRLCSLKIFIPRKEARVKFPISKIPDEAFCK